MTQRDKHLIRVLSYCVRQILALFRSYHCSLHGTLKYLRINFVQLNGHIGAHFGLLEVATEHCLEHRAASRECQLMAFEILQNQHSRYFSVIMYDNILAGAP
jgi:hypothetical protein